MEKLIPLNKDFSLRYNYERDQIHYYDYIFVQVIHFSKSINLVKGIFFDVVINFIDALNEQPKELPNDIIEKVKNKGIGYFYAINSKLIIEKNKNVRNDLTNYFLWGLSNDDYSLNTFIYTSNSKVIIEISPNIDVFRKIKEFDEWIENEYRILYKIELSDDEVAELKKQLNELKLIYHPE